MIGISELYVINQNNSTEEVEQEITLIVFLPIHLKLFSLGFFLICMIKRQDEPEVARVEWVGGRRLLI